MTIGRASLARENEAGGSWGQKVHILHVNVFVGSVYYMHYINRYVYDSMAK